MYVKFGKYDSYINAIPKKKVTIYPLEDWNTKVSQSYGNVDWKLYPRTGIHYGVDHAVPVGTPIYATHDGYLREDNTAIGALGKHCLYSFWKGNKLYTLLFAHLSKIKKVGEYKKGDIIAYTGNTGFSTNPHCHTELFKGLIVDRNRLKELTIDPIKFYDTL